MERLPPLRAMLAFRYAAKELSFKAAAETMNLSQAAISTHIRGLEEFLGFKLFERLTREVKLTEEGKTLSGYVESGFQEFEKGLSLFSANNDPGTLTISTVPSFASRWLVPRIEQFQARHPDIQIRLQPSLHLVNFQGDGIDLAIRFGDGNYPGLESRLLTEERLIAVCHPSLLKSEDTSAPALASLPWLLDESVDLKESWQLFQERLGVEIPPDAIKLRVSEGATLVEAVLAGRGISLMRHSLVADLIDSGVLTRPNDIEVPAQFQYYLVAPEAKFRTEKVRAFASWISKEIEKIRWVDINTFIKDKGNHSDGKAFQN